jgi:hypothetical protein
LLHKWEDGFPSRYETDDGQFQDEDIPAAIWRLVDPTGSEGHRLRTFDSSRFGFWNNVDDNNHNEDHDDDDDHMYTSTIPVCCNYLWFNQEEAWSTLNSIGSERCWLITSTSPFTKIDWSGQSDLRRIRSPFLFFYQTRSTSTNLQRQQWLESTFKGGYF